MKLGWSIRELKVGQGSIEGCKWQGGFGLPQISISKYKNEDLFIILFLWDVILRTQERSWKFHSHYFHYSNSLFAKLELLLIFLSNLFNAKYFEIVPEFNLQTKPGQTSTFKVDDWDQRQTWFGSWRLSFNLNRSAWIRLDKLGQNDITHFLFCRISVMNQELVSEYSVGFAFIFSVNLSNENKVFFIFGQFVSLGQSRPTAGKA